MAVVIKPQTKKTKRFEDIFVPPYVILISRLPDIVALAFPPQSVIQIRDFDGENPVSNRSSSCVSPATVLPLLGPVRDFKSEVGAVRRRIEWERYVTNSKRLFGAIEEEIPIARLGITSSESSPLRYSDTQEPNEAELQWRTILVLIKRNYVVIQATGAQIYENDSKPKLVAKLGRLLDRIAAQRALLEELGWKSRQGAITKNLRF
ncbi:uncharacterized protein RSE6_08194 [Rhynchosporium secalis]|uniref:Uncharacterized protein n=1 Tax=Rhynchosporium secalis TaxID=38038 RepID=A0A1E1MES6_RHYSE|nr:uncharacterized protein RSE6_08194 [Rhynchosporium secalis]